MQAFLPLLLAFSLVLSSGVALAAENVSSEGSPLSTNAGGSEAQAKPAVVDEATTKLSKDELTQLELLENHFFGRLHPSEVVNRRIERLERFVFGSEATGTEYGARLDKLSATLSTVDPDGKKHIISIDKPSSASSAGGGSAEQINPPTLAAMTGPDNASDDNKTKEDFYKVSPVMAQAHQPSLAGQVRTELQQGQVAGVLHCNKSLFPIDGEPVQVMRELSLAIKVHPLDPDLLFERAKAEMVLEKIDNALSDLSDAIMNNPNRSLYYLARALCYKRLGNSVLANDDLKQAKFVDPALPAKIDFLSPTANSDASKTQ